MQRLPRNEVPVAIEGDGVELRMRDEGGLTVFVRAPARRGANLAPASEGATGLSLPLPALGLHDLRGACACTPPRALVEYPAGEAFDWVRLCAGGAGELRIRRLLADR